MNLLALQTCVIPAGTALAPGRLDFALPSEFFLVWSASAPFQVQFDDQPVCSIAIGFRVPITYTRVSLFNPNNYSISVSFFYGSKDVEFNGLIQTQDLPTYPLGNLGLNASGNYNGTGTPQPVTISIALDNNGNYIELLNEASLTIAGINNGNKRRTIVFSVYKNSAKPLLVQDKNGNQIMTIFQGQNIALDTADTLIVASPATGGANWTAFNICELYYQS